MNIVFNIRMSLDDYKDFTRRTGGLITWTGGGELKDFTPTAFMKQDLVITYYLHYGNISWATEEDFRKMGENTAIPHRDIITYNEFIEEYNCPIL